MLTLVKHMGLNFGVYYMTKQKTTIAVVYLQGPIWKTTIAVVYLQGPIFVLFCSHCILVNLKGDLSQGAQRQSRGGEGALQSGKRLPCKRYPIVSLQMFF